MHFIGESVFNLTWVGWHVWVLGAKPPSPYIFG